MNKAKNWNASPAHEVECFPGTILELLLYCHMIIQIIAQIILANPCIKMSKKSGYVQLVVWFSSDSSSSEQKIRLCAACGLIFL